jgi:hypothetical protein
MTREFIDDTTAEDLGETDPRTRYLIKRHDPKTGEMVTREVYEYSDFRSRSMDELFTSDKYSREIKRESKD